MVKCRATLLSLLGLLLGPGAGAADNTPPEGFSSLFNGKNLTGWKVPAGDNGHWKVVDGVIDYDAQSEAAGDKSLWSDREYGDFTLHVDWRLKEAPYINKNVPYILPDGTHARDVKGKELRLTLPDADSGIFLRLDGCQVIGLSLERYQFGLLLLVHGGLFLQFIQQHHGEQPRGRVERPLEREQPVDARAPVREVAITVDGPGQGTLDHPECIGDLREAAQRLGDLTGLSLSRTCVGNEDLGHAPVPIRQLKSH